MFGGPQALITYANIPPEAILGGEFTLAHGTTPSVASMRVVPTVTPDWVGDLTITYGPLYLRFPDCHLLDPTEQDNDSGQTWILKIQDRRWKWQFGRIRGRYNLREAPGNNVLPLREKKPTELLEFLLESLGETAWNFYQVPNDVRPFVDWDDKPVGVLQRLLDQLGCRIWIDPQTDTVVVARVGLGSDLPFIPEITSNSLTASQPIPPDNMWFMGGQTLYQDDLLLEAVGLEGVGDPALGILPGAISPIADLTYARDFKWEEQDPYTLSNVAKRNRDAAQRSVWKYYRIVEPVVNNHDLDIPERRLILPLEDHLLEWHNVNGERVNLPPIVFGFHDKGEVTYESPEKTIYSKVSPPALAGHHVTHWFYAKAPAFSMDARRGLVMFSEPMNWSNQDGSDPPSLIPSKPGMFPALLWLRCCFGIRDPDTEAWERLQVTKGNRPPVPGTNHYVVREDEFSSQYWDMSSVSSPTFGRLITNAIEFQTAAEYYLDQERLRFMMQFPASRSYAGIILIPLDGAIQSVTWQIPERGDVTTIANRNREDFMRNVSYQERQQFTLLQQIKANKIEHDSNPLDVQTGTRRFGQVDAYY